jgi:VanZ family protein
MQRLLRCACLAYVACLTLLLFWKNPADLIGYHSGLPSLLRQLMPAAHLVSFSLLAVLALMPRWPLPRWSIVLMLAVYGGMTEVIQGFIPPRTPEWQDWFQDICGLAVGVACCWAAAILLSKTPLLQRIRTLLAIRRAPLASN